MQKADFCIAVTGAGGYIGSITTYALLREGYTVLAIDNFKRGYHQPLELLSSLYPGQLIIREIDLLLGSAPFHKEDRVHAVMHFAANCIVDESVRNPEMYLVDNPRMLQTVLEAMEQAAVSDIILSSTAAVYGDPEHLPVTEQSPVQSINPYGESKVLSESLLDQFSASRQISYLIFRYFNVCGASKDGLIGDSKKPSELLVQNAVRGALGIEPFSATFTKVDTPDGSPVRDFIDVEDLASAHLLGLHFFKQEHKVREVFNLGSSKGYSVLEIVRTVEEITDKRIEIKKGRQRLGEQPRMLADASKANQVLNWHPKRTLHDSILSLVTWYRAYPNGWSS